MSNSPTSPGSHNIANREIEVQLSVGNAWRDMQRDFAELSDFILTMRYETYEEARDGTYPRWFDRTANCEVRAWLLLPYRKTTNREWLREQHDFAKRLIPDLVELFEKRQLTVNFLKKWGEFCQTAGAINSLYFSEGDDLGSDRAGVGGSKAVSKDVQRAWVARCLLKLMKDGLNRNEAEDSIASYLEELGDCSELPEDFSLAWFKDLLRPGSLALKTTYQRKHFPNKGLESAYLKAQECIPPTPKFSTPGT